MPRKRKKAGDLTTRGLAERLFPKEVRDEVKRETKEAPKRPKKKKKSGSTGG